MRLAILSDIHGNLLALEAVLADLEARGGADATVIAGDLCLDGPRPLEALERVRALGCPVIQGNTDRDLAALPRATGDEEEADLLSWTRQRLGEDALAYLRTLPFAQRIEAPEDGHAVLVVHANPRNLDEHLPPLAPEEAVAPYLAAVAPDVSVVAFGHLHIPYTRQVGRLLLADIASVGLPKDGDRRAAYGLLTWRPGSDNGAGAWSVELRRVEFPVDEVVAQLRAADPPDVTSLVRTLLRARYPNMAAALGGSAPRRPGSAQSFAIPDLTGPWEPPQLSTELTDPATQPTVALPSIPGQDAPAPAMLLAGARLDALPPPSGTVDGSAPASTNERAARKARKTEKAAKRAAKRAAQPSLVAIEPFGPAIGALLSERLAAVLALEEPARAGEDPEAVHDMRVAIRRLRAALDATRSFVKPKRFKRQERAIKALTGALGKVRDADVLLAFLRERVAAAPEAERAGLISLIGAIEDEREDDRVTLLAALDRVREDDLARSFKKFARKLRKVATPVGMVATRELDATLARFTACLGALDDPGDVQAHHRLRIAAKRLRYTLELFSAALGEETAGLIEDIKMVQEDLGLLHDRDLLADLLIEERLDAATRELHALALVARGDGPRADRLAAVQERARAPGSVAATTPGIYGLLADVTDERRAAFNRLCSRWRALDAAGFLERARHAKSPPESRAGTRNDDDKDDGGDDGA